MLSKFSVKKTADRLISAGTTLPEDVADRAIRPKLLEEYVGQPQVRSLFVR